MGMIKKEYIDHLIIEEIAEKVANEPMEDWIDELDSDMNEIPDHVWIEDKVDETILERHDRRQLEMFDDYSWNWSGHR